MYFITRYHDICAGHRVVGHESKCAQLHGHNYRVHFKCAGDLDGIGRVIDFEQVKLKLCEWLEKNWDHKFLMYNEDPLLDELTALFDAEISSSIVPITFNPTAENMAEYLVETVGPRELDGTGVVLISCVVEETRKCSATYELPENMWKSKSMRKKKKGVGA